MSADEPNSGADDCSFWYRLGRDENLGVGEFYEWIIETLYAAILSPGDAAVDGGANRGRHTFPLSRVVAQNGLIVGFEAIPTLADALARALAAHHITNVLLRPTAIGSATGTVEFNYVPQSDGYSGIKERSGIPESARASSVKITVPLTTIDAALASIPQLSSKPVRFMKLDLEGGEYDALKGAQRTLQYDRPLVVFENGRDASARLYGYGRSDFFSMFESNDYAVFDVFGRSFTSEHWTAQRLPWYFIAAGREDDKRFVRERLPNLIHPLADACAVGCYGARGAASVAARATQENAIPHVQSSGELLTFGIAGMGAAALQSGWHGAEADGVWTNGPRGVVRLRFDEDVPDFAELMIEGRVLGARAPGGQALRILVDFGGDVSTLHEEQLLSDDFAMVTVRLPEKKPLNWSGEAIVTFQRDISLRPFEVYPDLADVRDLGFFLKSIRLSRS